MQLQTFKTDYPFDTIFLDFWNTGDLPGVTGARKILTYLCCTTRFASYTERVMNDPTSDQVASWYFSTLFVPYGLPKLIIVDADGFFNGVFKNILSELL